ncbi:hypothetical protein CVT25_011468 [Psilocybe cyanescens]|uniref:Uncharacterized protein n=1 Tax=Psilocybe cyanescens TaxID=93625 RepID=A0A409XAE8_PSICY|nr:hypothetical protein CVT25_011468 [Psilocybe cyanescens]
MSSTNSNVDCASCSDACGYLAPDPDVAGLGVIIAFLTTSALTWVCAVIRILHWFLNHTSSPNKVDELIQQYHARQALPAPSTKPVSPISLALYPLSQPIARPRKTLSAHVARLANVISPLLLALHDTQLASGLAISATALIRRRHAAISVYHFSVAADLTWIASGTQIVSFIFVRSDIKVDQIRLAHGASTHRIVQLLRATCMVIQMIVLLWLSCIQGDQRWSNSYACPVSCLENQRKLGGTPLNWMITNFVLVFWTYPVALLPLCRPIWSRWKDFKVKMDMTINLLSSQAAGGNTSNPTKRLAKMRGIVIMVWALLGSMSLEIIVQLGWFSYGVWSLVADRNWGDAYFRGDSQVANGCDPVRNTENDWGFGQIFPVMILIVLLMTFFQAHGDVRANEIAEEEGHALRGEQRLDIIFLLLEAGAWTSTVNFRPQAQIAAPSPARHGLRNR